MRQTLFFATKHYGMKTIKFIGITIAVLLFLVGLFFAYATINDYQPQECELISHANQCDTLKTSDTISVLSWNIGYAGLDKEMDFFYDGGSKMRPSEEQVAVNLKGIQDFLIQNDSIDFILLQEADKKAKRSYNTDQIDCFDKALPSHASFFALNYNVDFVPIPLAEPMGGVQSGLNSLSRLRPQKAERHAFPFNFNWPQKVFLLDRCFLATYHPLDNGKQLVIINTHNSAFDDNGSIRKAELNLFKDFLVNEYLKGNYVVVGGDFNQSPPNLKTDFGTEPFDFDDYVAIPDSLLPQGWHYVFDNATPSNRRVIDAYKKGTTKVTLIDFFITSPNIKATSVKCINLGFEHSDHNPVIGIFTFNNELKKE